MQGFIEKCRRLDKKIFVSEPLSDRHISYVALMQNVIFVANKLQKIGCKKDDRVILLFDNCIEYVIAHFALLHLGITAIPLNPRAESDYLSYIIQQTEPTAILTCRDQNTTIPEADCSLIDVDYLTNIESIEISEGCFLKDDFPITIMYTSGSTGSPKGVIMSYGAIQLDFLDYGNSYEFGANTNLIQSLPVYHGDGWCHTILCPFIFEATVMLTPVFNGEVAFKFEKLIDNARDNILIAVPSMLSQLTLLRHRFQKINNHSIKMSLCGSAKLHRKVLEEFEIAFETVVYENYSLTETLMISFFSSKTKPKHDSVGKILDKCIVKILDDGEIAVKSPYVFSSYFNDKEGTTAAFQNGWFLTGDIGYVDEENYLYLTGRKTETINRAGYKIDPNEIDAALLKYKDILDCITIGVHKEDGSEEPVSFVVLKKEIIGDKKDIYVHLSNHLIKEKLPGKMIFLDNIPRNTIGKVIKEACVSQIK